MSLHVRFVDGPRAGFNQSFPMDTPRPIELVLPPKSCMIGPVSSDVALLPLHRLTFAWDGARGLDGAYLYSQVHR